MRCRRTAGRQCLNRGRHAGYFLVRRFMRRVRTFGFHLATLDVTQHAHLHDQVIAQGLGIADWPLLAPDERLRQLRDLLARDQGPTSNFDAIGRRSLWVFEAIAQARHRRIYRQRCAGTRRRAGSAAAGAMGRYHRQTHG